MTTLFVTLNLFGRLKVNPFGKLRVNSVKGIGEGRAGNR
jgi:hypothetical protein